MELEDLLMASSLATSTTLCRFSPIGDCMSNMESLFLTKKTVHTNRSWLITPICQESLNHMKLAGCSEKLEAQHTFEVGVSRP